MINLARKALLALSRCLLVKELLVWLSFEYFLLVSWLVSYGLERRLRVFNILGPWICAVLKVLERWFNACLLLARYVQDAFYHVRISWPWDVLVARLYDHGAVLFWKFAAQFFLWAPNQFLLLLFLVLTDKVQLVRIAFRARLGSTYITWVQISLVLWVRGCTTWRLADHLIAVVLPLLVACGPDFLVVRSFRPYYLAYNLEWFWLVITDLWPLPHWHAIEVHYLTIVYSCLGAWDLMLKLV